MRPLANGMPVVYVLRSQEYRPKEYKPEMRKSGHFGLKVIK